MTLTEAKQTLMLELVRATAGNYSIEELLELYYFMTEPEEETKPTLTVLSKKEVDKSC
jgi:hypothetical protein